MQCQLLRVLHPDVTVRSRDVLVHVRGIRQDLHVHNRVSEVEDALLAKLGARFYVHLFDLHRASVNHS